MLRSVAPAINLKNSGEKITLRSFYYASLTSGYLWYSSFTAYAANYNSKKKTLFAGIRLEWRALLSSGLPLRVRKVRSCKSRFNFVRRNY